MNHARNAVVGAAAALVAGAVGVGTAGEAAAQPQQAARITSVQQLKASIAQAADHEKRVTASISCCPAGLVNPESTRITQA